MNGLEFIVMAAEEWPVFLVLIFACTAILYLAIRRYIVGGFFDPLVLALIIGYSINYAVVILLWQTGKSSFLLTSLVLGYGVAMLGTFRWVSRFRRKSYILGIIRRVTPQRIGKLVFLVSLFVFFALTMFVISMVGFGIFAETNRFDSARGFGGYIRIIDFLVPFIVSFSTASIYSSRRLVVPKTVALVLFILFAAMVNGAKISVIFSLFTALFTFSIIAPGVKIRSTIIIAGIFSGIIFSLVALSINLQKNNDTESALNTGQQGTGLAIEKLAYRVIAIGNTSYLLLPNDIIDKIATDNVFIRFITPYIGNTNASKIFGYPVGDYSVGRQAELYYNPNSQVAGGPTSHFDLFGYVYFGSIGGFLFAISVGAFLGSFNRAIFIFKNENTNRLNIFRVALLVTLWTRAVLVIIEPTLGLAYVIEVLIYFSTTSAILQFLSLSTRKKAATIASHRTNEYTI